jgi:hypothetical protein
MWSASSPDQRLPKSSARVADRESVGPLWPHNLSNRQIYEYEEAEVRKMMSALRDAISEVENRFTSTKAKSESKFKL